MGAAPIHRRGGGTHTFSGTDRAGKQEAWVAVLTPQGTQRLMGEVRSGYQPIFMALAAPDMHLLVLAINVTDLQGQCFAQAQTHGIGG